MDRQQFSANLPYISSDLVALIAERRDLSDPEATQVLYSSQLYEALEDEATKVWQYSTPMLYHLLEQEEKTGHISFPDV